MAEVDSRGWNWNAVEPGSIWEEASEEAHYLRARWGLERGGRLLDLGSGLGRHSLFMAEGGFVVDAFDLAEEGLRRLKREALRRGLAVNTSHGDMLHLPYPDATFDYLLAYHVIYHSDRAGVERVIAEIDRVLKPGAELFLTFNSTVSPQLTNPAYRTVGENTIVKTSGAEVGIPHYYVDETELRRLMKGFRLLRLIHKEDIDVATDNGGCERGCHFFVLAAKTR